METDIAAPHEAVILDAHDNEEDEEEEASCPSITTSEQWDTKLLGDMDPFTFATSDTLKKIPLNIRM